MNRRIGLILFLLGVGLLLRSVALAVQISRQVGQVSRPSGLVLVAWPSGLLSTEPGSHPLALPVFLSQEQLRSELVVTFPGGKTTTLPPYSKDPGVRNPEKPLVVEVFASPIDAGTRRWGWLLGLMATLVAIPLWRRSARSESAPPEDESLEEGGRLGDYRLTKRLGQGATGSVWEARPLGGQGETVAVKILDPALLSQDEFLGRFQREFAIAKRFDHPRLVAFQAMGQVKDTYYVTMPLRAGGSLREALAERLPPERALRYALQLAEGLAHAHQMGVVHRDLKPENILLDHSGDLAIGDFGMARALDSHTITVAGTVMGTPAYISPEAMSGRKVDPSADVYSLGVVYFEMFTGELPFCEPDPMQMLLAHLSKQPPQLPEEHPAALRELVARMLSKDPAIRPGAAEVALALGALT